MPAEAEAPLVVDADAVLSRPTAFQGFQAVAGRQGQVTQFARAIELSEPPQGHALNLRRQAVITPPRPQPLRLPASEAGNHSVSLSSRDNMSSPSGGAGHRPEAGRIELLVVERREQQIDGARGALPAGSPAPQVLSPICSSSEIQTLLTNDLPRRSPPAVRPRLTAARLVLGMAGKAGSFPAGGGRRGPGTSWRQMTRTAKPPGRPR